MSIIGPLPESISWASTLLFQPYASMYTGSTPSYGATRSLIKFFLPSLPSDSKIIEASFNAFQTKVG